MGHPRPGLARELVAVGLILACVGGTCALVLRVHRRAALLAARERLARSAPALTPPPPQVVVRPPNPPRPKRPPKPRPAPPPPAPPPVEDPTPRLLAALGKQVEENRKAAELADRKAEALEAARRSAVAEADRWRRREALVRGQVAELDAQADRLERDADALARERDVLAQERDASKAALTKARAKDGGYAVMPHKGPNGTWQRPVVIECRNGEAVLQPRGLTFSLLDLSPLLGSRGSPLVGAVAREMFKIQDASSPDGAPVVPYIYFLVRPDGIRPFYEARARLEPLGIAFGYELVDQDWEIQFPDPNEWDTPDGPKRGPALADARPPGTFTWPAERTGLPDPDENPFLWPKRNPGVRAGGPSLEDLSRDLEGLEPLRGGRGGEAESPSASRGERGEGAGGTGPGRGPGFATEGNLELPGRPGGRAGGPRSSGLAEGPGPSNGRRDEGKLNGNGLGELGRSDPGRTRRNPPFGSDDPRNGAPGASNSAADRFGTEGATSLAGAEPRGGRTPGTGPDRSGRVTITPSMLAVAEMAEDPAGEGFPGAPPLGGGSAPGALGGLGRPSGVGGVSGMVGLGPTGTGGGTSVTAGGGPSGGGEAGGIPGQGGSGTPASRRVDVPLELVVACGPDGVVLHPGGYRQSLKLLRTRGQLQSDLATIVRNHELIDPAVRPVPRLRFLVEPGGDEAYREERRQTVLTGLNWPVTIQMAGPPAPRVFPRERF